MCATEDKDGKRGERRGGGEEERLTISDSGGEIISVGEL